MYVYFSIIGALVGGIGLWRRNFKKAIPLNEQQSYRSIPRTTPKISELDPRAEGEVHLASQVESIEKNLQEKVESIQDQNIESDLVRDSPDEPS